jgi:hypothetical protein
MKTAAKVTLIAGLAAILKALSDQMPSILPDHWGSLVAVALAAAAAYLAPSPLRPRNRY